MSPAYDLNPIPVDRKARILSTNISFDDGTCSIVLALDQAGLFKLSSSQAKRIIQKVGVAVSRWREVAASVGESRALTERLSSAFEHADLVNAARNLNLHCQ